MPAPLAKGIIIAASIVVAAGIAIYESPQVRAWVDQSRRKIAVALHNLGDDIQPRRPSESSDDFDLRKRRREDLIRRNRNELIRRAREEGVAVDLDELARIGKEGVETAQRRSGADGSKSFDTMVGRDGALRTPAAATGNDKSDNGLRKRGVAGSAAGSAAATSVADLFVNDSVPSPKGSTSSEPRTRASTETLGAVSPPASAADLIDLTPESATIQPESHQETEHAAQSFYSFTSSSAHTEDPLAQPQSTHNELDHLSTGTLTPRSSRSHSIVTSDFMPATHLDDISILSMQNDTDHDARSDIFSEAGLTDAFSETGFSEFGDVDRAGVMTPNSWTDVGSDDESRWGGVNQNGHVSQV